MRKYLFYLALLSATITWAEAPLNVNSAVYRFESREFTVGMGDVTDIFHVRNVCSREFTIGMGKATDISHVRNVCSREFTIGVGTESVDIWPFEKNLAGIVTLQNGSQFIQDVEDAIVTCEIRFGKQTMLLLPGEPLNGFSYNWNTATLEDGFYTVTFTVSRPNHEDITGSRSYQLVNQNYEGTEKRTLTFPLTRGWNLLAPSFRLNASAFPKQFLLLTWDAERCCYVRPTSIHAGHPLWIFSPDDSDHLTCTTYTGISVASVLPQPLIPGWNLLGVCGDTPLVLDLPSLRIAAIFQWNGTAYIPATSSPNLTILQPGIGYYIYCQP